MKRSLLATSGLAGVALLAAACRGSVGGYGASSTPPTSSAAAAGPSATTTTLALGISKVEQIVVDGQGRSLYLFEADTARRSTCISAGCVAEWPPLTATGDTLARRRAGRQPTQNHNQSRRPATDYLRRPSPYHLAGDTQPGVTAGQGLNDNGGLWYVVHNDGTPVEDS